MGCAIGTVRYILFFFNFLLAVAGIGILALGLVTAYSDNISFNDVLHGQLSTPAIIISIVGACIFIFAFFGCCGALRESHCMVCTYAVLLLTLLVVQVAVAVVAYMYREQAQDVVTDSIKTAFKDYNNTNATREIVDNIQKELQCCGSDNTSNPWATLHISAPASCYKDPLLPNTEFTTACIPTLIDYVKGKLETIAEVAIGVAVVEVVGVIFSMCLASSIRRAELRGYA